MVQYSPQAFLIAFIAVRYNHWQKRKAMLMAFFFVFFCGALSEILQIFVESRIPHLFDVFWDAVAGFLGVLIFMGVEYARSEKK